jgi:Ni/Co efflux regulator RcnB
MTHSITLAIAAALLTLAVGAAHAQGAASAPAAKPGMGMGRDMRGMEMDQDNTPGWSLMSRTERKEHRDKMKAMTDHGACIGYMEEHHARMAQRAKERGQTLPAKPRRDACVPLKK